MRQINQLQENLAIVQSRNSGLQTDGSGIHGSPPINDRQSVQREETGNRPFLDTFPVTQTIEIRKEALDVGDQPPNVSERNRGFQYGEDAHTIQTEAAPFRGQDITGPSSLDVPHHQEVFADGSTSMPPPTLFNKSPRTGHNEIEDCAHLQREGVLRANQPGAVSDDLQETGGERSQDNDEPFFYGESSSTALMQEVQDIISPSANLDFSGKADTLRGDSSIYSAQDNYPRREENIRSLQSIYLAANNHIHDLDLPPRPLADHLVHSYFSRVHILYPFLHRPTFEAAYAKLWSPSTTRDTHGSSGETNNLDAGLGDFTHSGPDSRVFCAGINAIFALSCQFSDLPISKSLVAAKGYLERAMALLLHPEMLDNPSISVVQVLLLLCLHLQSTPLRNRLCNIIGLACTMAQGLALHDDDNRRHGNGTTKNWIVIEIGRRIWYSCTMLEM